MVESGGEAAFQPRPEILHWRGCLQPLRSGVPGFIGLVGRGRATDRKTVQEKDNEEHADGLQSCRISLPFCLTLNTRFPCILTCRPLEKPQHPCKHLKKRNRQLTRGLPFPPAEFPGPACKHRLDSPQRVVLSTASVSDSFRERKRKRFGLLSLESFLLLSRRVFM